MEAKKPRRWVRIAVILGVFVLGLLTGGIASAFSVGWKFGDMMRDWGTGEFMMDLHVMAMYHQGDEAKAIEFLEQRVDTRIVGLSHSMSVVRNYRENEQLIRAMRIARVYRETYPSGSPQAESVTEALISVSPITSEEPWIETECTSPLSELIRRSLASQSGQDADNS